MKIPEKNVLARILALLMGATRPPTSRNGRAADAIVPNMACMQDTRTEEPGRVFSWEMLTTHLNSITMKPRALGVSSTLAFVEHERGRGIYE